MFGRKPWHLPAMLVVNMLVRAAEVGSLVGEVKTGLPQWKCSASNQKLTRELFSQKQNIRVRRPLTQPFIHKELARRINLRFLWWVSRIWSGSHLVRAHLFRTSLPEFSLLSSGKPSRCTPPRLLKAFCAADAGRQKKRSSFLQKKEACFEVFYLLFFLIAADYDPDYCHCA